MRDFTSLRRSIEDHIEDHVSGIDIVFLNDPLEDHVTEFISVADVPSSSEFLEVGSSAMRVDGAVVITVNTPLNTGTVRSQEIASMLSKEFVSNNFDQVDFLESELHDVPITEKSTFFQQRLVIPYVSSIGTL